MDSRKNCYLKTAVISLLSIVCANGLSCKKIPGSYAKHSYIDVIIFCSLLCTNIQHVNEPTGVTNSSWNCPDGLTFIPWKQLKYAVSWYAGYFICLSELSDTWQTCPPTGRKYSCLSGSHIFVPIAVKWVIGPPPLNNSLFFADIHKKAYLWWRYSNQILSKKFDTISVE